MGKLGHREAEYLSQGHTARKWWSPRYIDPSRLALKSCLWPFPFTASVWTEIWKIRLCPCKDLERVLKQKGQRGKKQGSRNCAWHDWVSERMSGYNTQGLVAQRKPFGFYLNSNKKKLDIFIREVTWSCLHFKEIPLPVGQRTEFKGCKSEWMHGPWKGSN